MDYRFRKLAEYLRGWINYFGISEYYRPIPEIDQWLRRRLRMCYFKQWRRARTKVRELRKLGTSLHAAISVANKPAKARGDYPGHWQRKLV
jgi:RNA-directed DNA polymerase